MLTLAAVLDEGRNRDCAICGEPSRGQWCGLAHAALGVVEEETGRPVPHHVPKIKKQTRHGVLYKLGADLGVLDPCARGDMELEVGLNVIKANKGAKKLTAPLSSWRRAVNERKSELNLEVLTGNWAVSPEHAGMLGPLDSEMRRLATTDREAFEVDLTEAVEAFASFRNEFFEAPQGGQYLTKPFHRRWIKAILRAIYLGERLQILAPPRSGKTDLAIHFAVWLILRNPNIRILWVGASADMASKSVDSVRSHLEDNEKLRKAYLAPGQFWKSASNRGGDAAWSRNEFKVATRTVVGSKSPTMVGVGAGGKILSRDTDIIWLDDHEDHTSTIQPGRRESTKRWLNNTIESRKEPFTALIQIGSRQHPDDLYGYLIDKQFWTHIIEVAHDPDCDLPEDDIPAHIDCMIFPERLSYAYLMEKKETLDPRSFEMQYMGLAIPEAGAIFTREMVDACLNKSRGLGLQELVPKRLSPIAGLDPSPSSNQAGVLWGVDEAAQMVYLVDLYNGGDGGVDGAKRLMLEWNERYRLDYWVIEANSWQKALYLSDDVKGWARGRGIQLRPHNTTAGTKWDENYGVGSMRPAFQAGQIDLPYGTLEARTKVKQYRRQLVTFEEASAATRKRNVRVDIVMAGWFPWKKISRTLDGHDRDAQLVLSPGASYPGYGKTTEAPWSATPYRGATPYPGA